MKPTEAHEWEVCCRLWRTKCVLPCFEVFLLYYNCLYFCRTWGSSHFCFAEHQVDARSE